MEISFVTVLSFKMNPILVDLIIVMDNRFAIDKYVRHYHAQKPVGIKHQTHVVPFVENSTNICHRQTCPILSCEQDKQIRSAGQCCPKCSYENIGKMCIHKNRSYRHQESWKEQCQKCTCTDGTIECTTPKCDDFVCPSSYKKVKLDGECCDTCVQVDSTCVLKDGKILTYDRKRYHFDGKCNYVLTRECVDKSFSVHLVQKYLHSGQFEGQSLMVKIGDIKIYLSHLDRVRINQTLIQLPFIEINKFSIARIRNRIKLRSQLGFELLWVANKSVEMKVRNNFRSQLCGLCGNYNLDSEDEFQMKNSKKITTLDRFVKSFQVGQNVHCPRKRTQVPRRNMPILESSPWPQQAAARRLCLRIKARNTNCRNVNHSGDIYAQCLEDVVQCGDNRLCQCQVYEHLRNKCHSSNPNRPLDQSKCKSVQQCPPGSEFTACSLDCKRTCKNRHRSNNCSQQTCRPGCQCIGNRVWHQNQCIPEASCIS
ncbi:hypothetical protein RDWZM_008089 [Blomia tropicalis]|uniref:BMP-binding endothelial regulator protein n=1 Tax=Blomia tropicalis TaxID=40697 RepID=A0A9Q0M3R0_BLOTA|nr:hypothetical protein RDWZM_008089 [Blomia tropicalis]